MSPDDAKEKPRVKTEVITIGSLDAVTVRLRLDLTVQEAAKQAAAELGVQIDSPGFENANRDELEPTLTLAEAGVNDDYVLYLIDTAGGQ